MKVVLGGQISLGNFVLGGHYFKGDNKNCDTGIVFFLLDWSYAIYWASEASPTHRGVQSRFRVIYIYMYVGMYVCRGPKSVGGNTWAKHAHAQSQYCAVKSDQ